MFASETLPTSSSVDPPTFPEQKKQTFFKRFWQKCFPKRPSLFKRFWLKIFAKKQSNATPFTSVTSKEPFNNNEPLTSLTSKEPFNNDEPLALELSESFTQSLRKESSNESLFSFDSIYTDKSEMKRRSQQKDETLEWLQQIIQQTEDGILTGSFEVDEETKRIQALLSNRCSVHCGPTRCMTLKRYGSFDELTNSIEMDSNDCINRPLRDSGIQLEFQEKDIQSYIAQETF